MSFRKLRNLLAFALVLSIASCTKSGTTGPAGATGPIGPQGPTGPSYTGTINGHVMLYDQYGSKVTTGLTSVTVNFNGKTNITPDATGFYQVGTLATGFYYFTATNNGYGSTRINNFQFLGDTLNRDIKLSAIPGFSPASIVAQKIATGDSIALTFPMDNRGRNCLILINTNATVNGNPANYVLAYNRAIAANSNKPTIFIVPAQDFLDAGISTGTTVYIAAYGYVIGDASSYEDFGTGKTVYTPISATAATTTCTAP